MKKDPGKQLRKSFVEQGEIYFWTATIHHWIPLLKTEAFKNIILQSLTFLHKKELADIFAFVIMPNHIHLIWRMNQPNGKEMPHVSFLKYTAHEFKKLLTRTDPVLLNDFKTDASNKSYEFWQRDSLAFKLYKQKTACQKLNYIHRNPLSGKWQLVRDPCEYFYSTAAYYETGVNNFSFVKDLRDEF